MALSIFLQSKRHVTSIVATPIAPPETLALEIFVMNLKTAGFIFAFSPPSAPPEADIISETAGITKVAASIILPYMNCSPLSLKNIPENSIVMASIGPIASSVAYESDDAWTNTRFLSMPFAVVSSILSSSMPTPASPLLPEYFGSQIPFARKFLTAAAGEIFF